VNSVFPDLLDAPAGDAYTWFMTLRSRLFTLGFLWDFLRFFLLFAFLAGNRGTGVFEGNFLILLLGISGQPVVSLLWRMEKAHFTGKTPGVPGLLAAGRAPGLLVEFAGIAGFFLRILPGQGETLLLENTIFPGGTGVLLLLFVLLADVFFELFLLTLYRKKEL